MRVSTQNFHYIWAVLATAYVLLLSRIFPPEVNPDWLGYAQIYIDGAWLAESNRDLLFRALITVYKLASPFGSYESFRVFLLFAFAALTFAITALAVKKRSGLGYFILMAICSVATIRFSIQIREGLSIALILLFIVTQSEKPSVRIHSSGWLLLTASAAIHIVGIVFLISFFLSTIFGKLNLNSRQASWSMIWFFSVLTVAIFFWDTSHDASILQIDSSFTQNRYAVESGLDFASTIYWSLKYCGAIAAFYTARRLSLKNRNAAILRGVRLLSGPIAFLIAFCIITFKFNLISPIYTVLLVRSFDAIISVSIFYCVAHTKSRFLAFALCSWLILDVTYSASMVIN